MSCSREEEAITSAQWYSIAASSSRLHISTYFDPVNSFCKSPRVLESTFDSARYP